MNHAQNTCTLAFCHKEKILMNRAQNTTRTHTHTITSKADGHRDNTDTNRQAGRQTDRDGGRVAHIHVSKET